MWIKSKAFIFVELITLSVEIKCALNKKNLKAEVADQGRRFEGQSDQMGKFPNVFDP